MQTMTTMAKAWDRVFKLSQNCYDEVVPVSDIAFDGIDTMTIAGERHPVRPVCQPQIATRLGVPFSYLARCPADLQNQNLSYWLAREKNENFFVRFDGAEARALFTERYTSVDNIRVLERLDELGFGADPKIQISLDGEFMSLSGPPGDPRYQSGRASGAAGRF